MSTTYIPGVCNIGPAEIKLRKLFGLVGLSATIILFSILLVGGFDKPWRLIIFVPALISTVGYLQAWFHFCVRFGTRGLFNMGTGPEKDSTVDSAAFRKKDQRKALIITGLSALIAIVITALVFILP